MTVMTVMRVMRVMTVMRDISKKRTKNQETKTW
jgi:hypothetical protein